MDTSLNVPSGCLTVAKAVFCVRLMRMKRFGKRTTLLVLLVTMLAIVLMDDSSGCPAGSITTRTV